MKKLYIKNSSYQVNDELDKALRNAIESGHPPVVIVNGIHFDIGIGK